MTPRVTALRRHPIKAHGREALERVTLVEGQTMPWDRRWAVAHEAAQTDGAEWAPCANFSRGAKVPALMAIEAVSDVDASKLVLTHPQLMPLSFDPDTEEARFLDWVKPLMPENRAQSARILRVEGRGMTDTDFPSISLNNMASLRTLSGRMGRELSVDRWRGNIWMDGLAPWEEFDWIGKTVQIGEVELKIEERITRCMATTANPETGHRDADTLGALDAGWGHQDFGVYGVVTKGGEIMVGDKVTVL